MCSRSLEWLELVSMFFLLGLIGCGGSPGVDDDAGGADCAAARDGTSCGTDRICLDGVCIESQCGDGYVDPTRDEECDDANSVAFDGCDPVSCTFTCNEDAECDDHNPCNGADTCDDDHRCQTDVALAAGDPCSTETIADGVCRAGEPLVCVAANVCGNQIVEGDEACDDGNTDDDDGCTSECAFTCTTDAECGDDGDACNGVERCDQIMHVCVTDTPPTATWYVDCDGDGFASSDVGAIESCTRPAAPPTCIPEADGAWVALPPSDYSSTDCYDHNADMRPGQTAFFTMGSGASVRPFDYDCNMDEEAQYTDHHIAAGEACEFLRSGTTFFCQGANGWTGAEAPCGDSASYSICAVSGFSCVRSSTTRTQGCR